MISGLGTCVSLVSSEHAEFHRESKAFAAERENLENGAPGAACNNCENSKPYSERAGNVNGPRVPAIRVPSAIRKRGGRKLVPARS